jgi:antitoxin (DNA-binding transcriptional repressor) of toxin-antitoxin stability system
MRSKSITVTEAARHFSEYVGRVAYRHESFVLHKGKKAVAELRPVPAGIRLGDLPELLASLPRLTPEEATAFAEDLRAARARLDAEGMPDRWRS